MDEGGAANGGERDHGHGTFRTWDGHPISPEPPHGAMIVVYRCSEGRPEFLLLHRRHNGADYEGDWAWTPPSGARYPGEPVDGCARRELEEETGLILQPTRVSTGSAEWPAYVVEVSADTPIQLCPEHDRYVWLPFDETSSRLAPAVVRDNFATAASTLPGCE